MMNHQGARMRQILMEHEGAVEYAQVQCIGDDFTCSCTERVDDSASKTDEQITQELTARGWSVMPTLCPDHQERS